MSNPINPLDRYSAVSHHFILLATAETETARNLANVIRDASVWYKVKMLTTGERVDSTGTPINTNDGALVCVANTAVDSFYRLDDVAAKLLTCDAEGKGTFVPEGALTMSITEPSGVYFLDFLKKVMDEDLKVGINGAVWMLIPYFVGYEGTTTGITTTDDSVGDVSEYIVTPSALLMTDINGSINEGGSTYKLSFIDISNGGANNSLHYGYVNRMTISTDGQGDKTSLMSAIKNFETQMNVHHRKLKESLEAQGVLNSDRRGRLVQYHITIPKEWESFHLESINRDYSTEAYANKVKLYLENNGVSQEDSKKAVAGSVDAQQLSKNAAALAKARGAVFVPTNFSVTVNDVLLELIKHCPELNQRQADLLKSIESGNYKKFKLFYLKNSITSSDSGVTVHYEICDRYFVPPELTARKGKADTTMSGEIDKKLLSFLYRDPHTNKFRIKPIDDPASNLYEFDYIFTGKNTDIRDMSLNVNQGIVYFASKGIDYAKLASINKSNPEESGIPGNDVERHAGIASENAFREFISGIRDKTPICIPREFMLDLSSKANETVVAAEAQKKSMRNMVEYMSTDSAPLAMVIRIRGNPMFFEKSLKPILPHDNGEFETVKHAADKAAGAASDQDQGYGDYKNYNAFLNNAFLVRVNVQYPIRGDGREPLDINDPSQFRGFTEFWYNGFYRVNAVTSKFIGNEFEQELELLAIDIGTGDMNEFIPNRMKALGVEMGEFDIIDASNDQNSKFVNTRINSVRGNKIASKGVVSQGSKYRVQ